MADSSKCPNPHAGCFNELVRQIRSGSTAGSREALVANFAKTARVTVHTVELWLKDSEADSCSGLEFCTDQELRQAQFHLLNNMRERGVSIAAGDSLFAMVGGVVSNKLADVMAMAIHMELMRREVVA